MHPVFPIPLPKPFLWPYLLILLPSSTFRQLPCLFFSPIRGCHLSIPTSQLPVVIIDMNNIIKTNISPLSNRRTIRNPNGNIPQFLYVSGNFARTSGWFWVPLGAYENLTTGTSLPLTLNPTRAMVPPWVIPSVVPVSVARPNQKLVRSKDLTPGPRTSWA